jgi:integrase/recombinase XerD
MSTALIAIFVRHSEECKRADDELYRRCNCRKHLRWKHKDVQYRKTAGTRSWVDAEQANRDREDQLAGRTSAPSSENDAQTIAGTVSLFIADKNVQGLTPEP